MPSQYQGAFRANAGVTFDNNSAVGFAGLTADNNEYTVAQATDGSLWLLLVDSGFDFTRNELFRAAPSGTPGTAGTGASSITTQQAAQEALKTLESAIIAKDNIRANLGALQNRLENTITNLTIQRENIVAAESRISDIDVAFEMTSFINLQIRTQAALTMLSQANIVPQMALSLLGG